MFYFLSVLFIIKISKNAVFSVPLANIFEHSATTYILQIFQNIALDPVNALNSNP